MGDKITVGSLFAGIGGIELGLERTGGFETVWQVEKDEYCRKVLAKHWPNVNRYEDVEDVGSNELREVDLICGGFPCQDISVAGKGEGIEGERSGLWSEMWRIIRGLRPRYALVENVSAIRSRGLGRVLGDLAEVGYDAEWSCLRAEIFGVPQRRERLFIISYPSRQGTRQILHQNAFDDLRNRPWIHAKGSRSSNSNNKGDKKGSMPVLGDEPRSKVPDRERSGANDGVSRGLDRSRYRALGNAVVPQVAEFIGEQILKVENG